MSGAEFKAIRLRYGWTQIQVCRALHYCRTACYDWERGAKRVPPAVAAWALALPIVPPSRAYPVSRGGFRAWFADHDMTCRELADFCGVAEHSVCRWLLGTSPLPPGVRAWLGAGAPPMWYWAPPGWDGAYPEGNTISRPGKQVGHVPLRRQGNTRRLGSWVVRRYRAEAQPRPWRRKAATNPTQERAS